MLFVVLGLLAGQKVVYWAVSII